MFFNKETIQVTPRGDYDLLVNTPNTLHFYIKEVISGTTLDYVSFQPYSKDLKNITILSPYNLITTNTSGDYVVTYTPTVLSKDSLYFNFKVITSSGLTHIVSSKAFSIIPNDGV